MGLSFFPDRGAIDANGLNSAAVLWAIKDQMGHRGIRVAVKQLGMENIGPTDDRAVDTGYTR